MNTGKMIRAIRWSLLTTVLAAGSSDAQQVVTLPAADKPLSGQPQTLFSVGKEDGQDTEVFSFVPSVAFDAQGNLYVVDRDNARVQVFGPDGRFLRQIGQKGQGPGELGLPLGVTILADGRVAVFDIANGAVSVFSQTGQYETLARPDPQFSGVRGLDFWSSPKGGVFLQGGNIRLPGPGTPPEVLDSVPVLLVPIGGGPTRAIVQVPAAKPTLNSSGGANNVQIRMTPPPEFSPVVTWAPLPDGGLAVSHGKDYEIHVVRPDGKVAWTLKRPMAARRTTDRDRENVKQIRRTAMETGATNTIRVTSQNGVRSTTAGGAIPREQIESILANMTFAETVPVVRRIRADREGRIWIERDGGPGSNDYPLDVISFNGVYEGTIKGVKLPAAFGPDGRAAFIETDDLGVQRVTVRRLPQSWLRPVPACSPPECR
jgi:hypothetical protein